MSPLPDADWTWARDLLVRAVAAGGDTAMRFWRQAPAERRKTDGTPVSEADLAVDALLQTLLRQPYPDIAWLSEESADPPDLRQRSLAWVVDPIDGTRPFLAGEPDFCIAACLCAAGAPVAAAIYCPPRGDLFEAALGRGARLNGAVLAVRDTADIDEASILAARSNFGSCAPRGLRPNPAMCLALADVAAGRAHAVAAKGAKADWDLAAGALLVQEAGGRATRLSGAAFNFNQAEACQPGLIAAGPALHALLQDRLAG